MQNKYTSQRSQQMQNKYTSQRSQQMNNHQQQSKVTPQRYGFSTLNKRGGAHRGERRQRSTRTAVNNNINVQCYSCKGFVNYSNSCPRKNSSKTCYYCGKPGHLQRISLKRQNDEQFDQGGNSRNTKGSRDFRKGPGTRQM